MGGFEGDIYGFHAKAYAIHDGSTTVPYAVITFLNQGIDEGRDAAFTITSLLQDYVQEYDAGNLNILVEVIFLVLISIFAILLVISISIMIHLKKKKSTSQNHN